MKLTTNVRRTIRLSVITGLSLLGFLPASARTITIPVPPHPEIHRADPTQIPMLQVRLELQQGVGPKIRLDDKAYVKLQHAYLPVLLDWHHEMRAHFARINDGDGCLLASTTNGPPMSCASCSNSPCATTRAMETRH